MKRTAIYIRVSTTDQESGLESQRATLLSWVKNHGIENYKIYQDKISGAKDKRPGLDELKADVFNGVVDTIITWKLDRISRGSIASGINLLHGWLKHGIRFVSIQQQFDFSGAVGEVVAALLFGIAQMERENIIDNVKRGQAKALNAQCPVCGKMVTPINRDILKSPDSRVHYYNCCGQSWQGKRWGGSEKGRHLTVTQSQVEQVLKLKQAGYSVKEIVKLSHVSQSSVYRLIRYARC